MNKKIENQIRFVTIGGGTGNSMLLSSLKEFSDHITAIVSMVDDGGSSGVLRKDLNILPPGDIRACLLALSNADSFIKNLFSYRFNSTLLKNQSLGNLILAAATDLTGDINKASQKMKDILNLKGRVLPATLDDIILVAELENGEKIYGESNIGSRDSQMSRIKKIYLKADKITPLPEAIESILIADIICIGPGSLYTSTIPPLLIPGIMESLLKTSAKVYLISNLVTQRGETDNYTLLDHLKVLEEQVGLEFIDGFLVNTKSISKGILESNLEKGIRPLFLDSKEKDFLENKNLRILEGNFIHEEDGKILHEAQEIIQKILFDYKKD